MIPMRILTMRMYQMDTAEKSMCWKAQIFRLMSLRKKLMPFRMEIMMHLMRIRLLQRQGGIQRTLQAKSSGVKLPG